MSGKQKADAIIKEKRIEAAVNALIKGNRVEEVAASMMSQYAVSKATAYVYTKEATARIHKTIEQSIELHVNLHYKRLEYLYQQAMRDKDIRTARMVLKDIADLLGLDAPKQRILTGANGGPIQTATLVGISDIDEGIALYEKMKAMRAAADTKRKAENTQEGEIVETNAADDVKSES